MKKSIMLLFVLLGCFMLCGNPATATTGSYSEGAIMTCTEMGDGSPEAGQVVSTTYGSLYGIGCDDHFDKGVVIAFILKDVVSEVGYRLKLELFNNGHGYLNRTSELVTEGDWVTEKSEYSPPLVFMHEDYDGGTFDIVASIDYGNGYVRVSNRLITIGDVADNTLPSTSVQGSSLGGDFNLLRVGNMLFASGDVELEVSLTGQNFVGLEEKNCLLTDAFNGETVFVRRKSNPGNVFEASFSSANQTITALTPGWHLQSLSFPSANALAEYSKLGDVWAWKNGSWGVFLPGEADGGVAYAASKGFVHLESLCSGMGFWINVASGGVISLPMAIPN
jgi:hypothetical protein